MAVDEMKISTNKWMVLIFLAGVALSVAVWYFTGHWLFVILLFPPLFMRFGKSAEKKADE
jgi:hypothetical protein